MNVTYIFNDDYVSQFLTVTNSIILNELPDKQKSIIFYINYFGDIKNISLLQELSRTHFPNNSFYFKHIPSEFPSLFKKIYSCYDFESAHRQIQTCSVYCRFYLDEIWHDFDGVFLYLDLDLIVKGPISNLFGSLDDKFIFHSPACTKLKQSINNNFTKKLNYIYDKYQEEFLKFKKEKDYLCSKDYNLQSIAFNGGVWLVDIKKYRDSNIKSYCEFLMICHSREKLVNHNDQGIMNVVFYENFGKINSLWNCLDYGWQNFRNIYHIKKRLEEGYIIHYNGEVKPWTQKGQIGYFKEGGSLWKSFEIKHDIS
jgi:lipopolysaccharide biosynthesis glycosyltransferase